ncbi:MAG: hypothetical protein JWQ07_98 [Ramlibacter sp.]|nr:hypothetical protein [Ramlibacter sp.]
MFSVFPTGTMFRVFGTESEPHEWLTSVTASSKRTSFFIDPKFRLRPTPTYFACVGLGVVITAIPLLARTTYLGMVIGLLLLLCAVLHIVAIADIGWSRVRLGNQTQLLLSVPSLQAKRHAAIWLFCLLPASAIALLMSFRGVAHIPGRLGPIQFGPAAPMLGCLLVWAGFCLIWTRFSPSFRLPELEGAYRSVSQTVKEKITQTTRRMAGEPVRNWRAARNIAQEFHLYGLAGGLFRSDIEGAVWKRGIRAFIWYYAPVTLPLAILLALPILNLLPFPALMPASQVPERFELALAAVTWASWSMPFFIVVTESDFGGKTIHDPDLRPTSDVDVFALGEEENRKVLREYMSESGLLALQVLVLAITPMLFSYFGLFPEPSKEPECCRDCDHPAGTLGFSSVHGTLAQMMSVGEAKKTNSSERRTQLQESRLANEGKCYGGEGRR